MTRGCACGPRLAHFLQRGKTCTPHRRGLSGLGGAHARNPGAGDRLRVRRPSESCLARTATPRGSLHVGGVEVGVIKADRERQSGQIDAKSKGTTAMVAKGVIVLVAFPVLAH